MKERRRKHQKLIEWRDKQKWSWSKIDSGGGKCYKIHLWLPSQLQIKKCFGSPAVCRLSTTHLYSVVKIKDCSFQRLVNDHWDQPLFIAVLWFLVLLPPNLLFLFLGIFSTTMSKSNQSVYLTHEIPETLSLSPSESPAFWSTIEKLHSGIIFSLRWFSSLWW